MTRSWAATASSRVAVLLTSMEAAVVLGRPSARASALLRVRQAKFDKSEFSDSFPSKIRQMLTDGQGVPGISDNILSTGTSNETRPKEENLPLLVTLLKGSNLLGVTTKDGPDVAIFLQEYTSKLRKDEGSLMDLHAPVASVLYVTEGNAEVVRLATSLCCEHETNLSAGVAGNGGKSVGGLLKDAAKDGLEVFNKVHVEPQALSLGRDLASRGQCIVKKLEVRLLEERLGRSNRIRRVGNDNIVGGGVISEELETITDVNADAGG